MDSMNRSVPDSLSCWKELEGRLVQVFTGKQRGNLQVFLLSWGNFFIGSFLGMKVSYGSL